MRLSLGRYSKMPNKIYNSSTSTISDRLEEEWRAAKKRRSSMRRVMLSTSQFDSRSVPWLRSTDDYKLLEENIDRDFKQLLRTVVELNRDGRLSDKATSILLECVVELYVEREAHRRVESAVEEIAEKVYNRLLHVLEANTNA